MSRDLYGDRSGFAAARRAFVTKAAPEATPERLRLIRPEPARAKAITRPRNTAPDQRPVVRPAVPMPA